MVQRVGGEDRFSRSSGGLVAGLAPLHDSGDGLWIGTLGTGKQQVPEQTLSERRLVVVPVSREDAKRHYEGFSNGVLWPLFHYLPDLIRFDPRDFEAYQRVNERFADVVAAHARPGDRIWVHDYHLMLLPAMLRERLPDACIGFFFHIPFVSSEIFRVVPHGEDILHGLLGADLIGLHTYDYARHLVTCCRRMIGFEFDERWVAAEGNRCQVAAFPLGVDAEGLRERARQPGVERRVQSWRRQVGDRKIILGVDRLDYTKGLTHRLNAYRRLLETEPAWRQDAQFIQLAVPSRSSIRSYQILKEEIERKVGEINGAFATESNVPIRYMYRSVSPEELSALYRVADVALVTPVRDGMNLVAKEYVASRLDDSGVLVLSEFAGAAWEMGEALLVNPWDVDSTARAIDLALRMSREEQGIRMAALRNRIATNNVHEWSRRFLNTLEATRGEKAGAVGSHDEQWAADLQLGLAQGKHALLALDLDGTLAHLSREPESRGPDPELLTLLGNLATFSHVEVVILSSRDRKTLERWFGPFGIHLLAEHGLYIRRPSHASWEVLLHEVDRSWIASVRPVLEDYSARTPGAFIEEKEASLSWHFGRADPTHGRRHALELTHHLTEALARSPLAVLRGPKVVEVRRQAVHKGAAYLAIARELGPFDFVLAAGDDKSDEDLFRALPADAWSIKVGAGPSIARFRLESPQELRALLSALVQQMGGGTKPAKPKSLSTASNKLAEPDLSSQAPSASRSHRLDETQKG